MPSNHTVAIVTGAARPWGLGRATALGLAAKGCDIAVADIRDDWGKEAVDAIKKGTGRKAIYVKTDISNKAQCDAMAKRVEAEFGRIDILCNVAAIVKHERIEELKEETIDRILAINLKGTIFTCQAVIPAMRNSRSGRIVNVASGNAVQPLKGLAAYSASKAGIVMFTKTLAWEVARYGIIATCVAPGRMITKMGSDEGPGAEDFSEEIRGFPFLRGLRPEEVADVIIYAAMNTSPSMAGQTFHANGGAYMV